MPRRTFKKVCAETIVTFPRMGIYTEAWETLIKELGLNYKLPPPLTRKSIGLGVKYVNELFCMPLKSTLGNLIEAVENGANTIIMYVQEGSCRFKLYYIYYEKIMKKLGYNHVKVIPIRPSTILWDLKKVDRKINIIALARALNKAWKKIKEIEEREEKKNPENADIKIAVVGEIYCVEENKINMDIFDKLRKNGAYVYDTTSLSHYIRGKLFHLDHFEKKAYKKEARQDYLPFKKFGGHGFESVYNTIYAGKNKFDGVIHILPFPCAPESSISDFLDMLSEKYDIPVLHLIYDEQTADAGVQTRIDAFCDMIRMRKAK